MNWHEIKTDERLVTALHFDPTVVNHIQMGIHMGTYPPSALIGLVAALSAEKLQLQDQLIEHMKNSTNINPPIFMDKENL